MNGFGPQNPEGGYIERMTANMGADSAIGCNELETDGAIFGENPIDLNQSSGPALIGVIEQGRSQIGTIRFID